MAIVVNLARPNEGVDRKLCSVNRSFPSLAVVKLASPLYPGEIVLVEDTGKRYRGMETNGLGRWGYVDELIAGAGGG